jgi:phosphoenolpyruvate carboxykinase (ATP)
MKLGYTRTMVRAALSGALDSAAVRKDPVFGLSVPTEIEGIPASVLDPRGTWPNGEEYDTQAKKLAEMFRKNFEKFGSSSDAIKSAGPQG